MQHYISKEISGKLFNELIGETKIYKILKDTLYHHNFQYKEGLNIDTVVFNPTNECKLGGLYFCEEKFLINYIYYGIKIATVEILDDACVYVENKKFKADKLILSNIILLHLFTFKTPIL